MKLGVKLSVLLLCFFATSLAQAQDLGVPALSVTTSGKGEQTYTLTLQVLAVMTALTLLPAALMMLTSFTRIIIVLAIVRQAVGLPQAPSGQVLIGLSLFLTFFVMAPVFDRVYAEAVQPYLDKKLELVPALEAAGKPFREFMMNQTRDADMSMFLNISGKSGVDSTKDIGFTTLIPAFVTSELKTAYQIGFMIFIPFLVIDLVVASVLMAMGMMMLSPMIISLPFKIMLFVLVDGWALIMGTLASSFYV
ncbi:MAG: flagellar type III secretion system pore protein FliP [Gammaproteobacteria bacterium]|nr:flagellar type III secretion system pore protein FliP [Gammaproteobacteria bacterium]MDH5802646.1 flagellar type III secretion system pore protein FliP [Gammaproteobacteria bacterium]